ncbi:MAG: hypothetical protein SGPRY_014894, partial [Prymnesium sp.]
VELPAHRVIYSSKKKADIMEKVEQIPPAEAAKRLGNITGKEKVTAQKSDVGEKEL